MLYEWLNGFFEFVNIPIVFWAGPFLFATVIEVRRRWPKQRS